MNGRVLLSPRRGVALVVVAILIMMGTAATSGSGLAVAPLNPGSQSSQPFDSDPPGAPTGLTATVVSTAQIDLSWTNPTGSLTDNILYFWVAASCSGSPSAFVDFGGVYQTYPATGLTPSATYSFEVTASSSGGQGPPSNCATATTFSLSPPTGLAATVVSTAQIDLSWTNPTGSLTDNILYFWVAASCSGSPSAFVDFGGVYQTYPATGLTPSATYSFEVTASSSGGQGPPSNCATATTFSLSPPTGLAATVVSTAQIDLSWTNPVGPLTDDFIYLFSGSDCSSQIGGPTVLGAPTTSYAWVGFPADSTFSFEVTAVDSTSEGPPSNCASCDHVRSACCTERGSPPTAASVPEIDLLWTNPVGPLTGNFLYLFSGSSCSSPDRGTERPRDPSDKLCVGGLPCGLDLQLRGLGGQLDGRRSPQQLRERRPRSVCLPLQRDSPPRAFRRPRSTSPGRIPSVL